MTTTGQSGYETVGVVVHSSVECGVIPVEKEIEEGFMISSNAMKAIVDIVEVYVRFGMIDSGSNIQLATYAFAMMCGRPIELEKQNRCIGTAEQEGSLPIFGWIDVGGYIGVMAVCKGAAFTLLSVGICQSRGLGCRFPTSGYSSG